METKQYLEYLDREMTIMGVLTAVAVVAPGGILNAALTSDKGQMGLLWKSDPFFILAGSVFCIFGALFFYKQRSYLAWYFGQISLEETIGTKDSVKLREWLLEADSWATWWPYGWGFIFLIAGFVEYVLALVFFLLPQQWHWLDGHLWLVKSVLFCACPLIAATIAAEEWFIRTRYSFSDHPHADCWAAMLKHDPNEETPPVRLVMPHDGVFTRLKPSSLHGVGVFAIRDIPKGSPIFGEDEGDLFTVTQDEVKVQPAEFQELYKDFCPRSGDTYQCPRTFNDMTLSWYLNTSKSPNVAADEDFRFRAIRDIGVGEELTTDYDTYSDNDQLQ